MKVDIGGGLSRIYYTNRFAPRSLPVFPRPFVHTFNIGFYIDHYFVFTNFTLSGGHTHSYNFGNYPTFDEAVIQWYCVNGAIGHEINGERRGVYFNSTIRALCDFKSP